MPCTGMAAASPSAQIVRPLMLSADVVEQVEVLRAALAVLDAVDHAPQPAGALAAGRALAAGFVRSRSRTGAAALSTMQRVSSITITAPEPSIEPGLGDGVVVHRAASIMISAGSTGDRRAAGDHAP
jgi:hypothetical protein